MESSQEGAELWSRSWERAGEPPSAGRAVGPHQGWTQGCFVMTKNYPIKVFLEDPRALGLPELLIVTVCETPCSILVEILVIGST